MNLFYYNQKQRTHVRSHNLSFLSASNFCIPFALSVSVYSVDKTTSLLLLWMSLLYVVGFGLKLAHLLLALCFWIISVMYMNWFNNRGIMETKVGFLGGGGKMWLK